MWRLSLEDVSNDTFECDSSYTPDRSHRPVSKLRHPNDIRSLTHALNRATLMEKWNLKYSGDGELTLSEFLLRVELNARADNLCKDDVYSTFFRLLKGNALHWYEGCFETLGNWGELIAALKYRFQPLEYDFCLREEIKCRMQHLDEPAQVYITHMLRLFRKLDPGFTESEKVFIIQKNMLPRYSMQLVIRNVKSVDHISKLCKTIDESGQASTGDEPLEPSCYPPKKSIRHVTGPKNLPRPLKIVAQANKSLAEAANCNGEPCVPSTSSVLSENNHKTAEIKEHSRIRFP